MLKNSKFNSILKNLKLEVKKYNNWTNYNSTFILYNKSNKNKNNELAQFQITISYKFGKKNKEKKYIPFHKINIYYQDYSFCDIYKINENEFVTCFINEKSIKF